MPVGLTRALLCGSMAAVALATGACSAEPSGPPLPIKVVIDVPLGHATSRYDYESLDPVTGRLFIADLAGGRVVVVDTRTNRLVTAIPDVRGVHGVLAVPGQGRVYASATGDNALVTIDARTLKVIARVPAGYYPDAIAWVLGLNKLYVSDEHGKTVTVIDASSNKLMTKIPIGGDVGNTQYDAVDKLIYSNNQSTNELVAIDPKRDIEVSRWKLPGCEENHGLLLDAARQLAYIACQGNARLVTFSLADHKLLDLQPIGSDPDVLAADFGLKRLYVAAESGIVSVFDVAAPIPHKLGEAKLAANAHVVAVDPATHQVYFPLRKPLGTPVLRVMAPTR